MPFVVDASVTACWFMPDERHPIADAAYRRVARDTAVAPVLWWYEVRNVLVVSERRGRLDGVKTAGVLRLLAEFQVAIDADVEEKPLMQLARRHRLTIYDAAYLELALRRDYPLATLDAALSAAARTERVQLIGEGSGREPA
jgi:predicted nucleic acid-binding protein